MYNFDNKEKKFIRKKVKSLLQYIKNDIRKNLRDLIK